MAERRDWHGVCFTMTMRLRLARLFTIKTRTEALFVTYAIAVGAVERGLHYMEQYPGYAGVVLALACLGVPFIAGAKLIDSVKPQPAVAPAPARALAPHRRTTPRFSRNRPMYGPTHRGSALRSSRRTD
jgi:hypothetical protein